MIKERLGEKGNFFSSLKKKSPTLHACLSKAPEHSTDGASQEPLLKVAYGEHTQQLLHWLITACMNEHTTHRNNSAALN